ncbi:hypothetical protein BTVI_02505 [Pitangus sulphuratus]|nr:hypothetical protein BTVI_02505 [Pitangus sulphuratus]
MIWNYANETLRHRKAEQPKLSQPVFSGEMLQSCDKLSGPPLKSFQEINIFLVLEVLNLDAILQVLD